MSVLRGPRWVDFWYGVFSKFGAKFVLRLCLVVYTLQVLANYSVQTCYHLVLNFVKTNKPALWKMSEILFFTFMTIRAAGPTQKVGSGCSQKQASITKFFLTQTNLHLRCIMMMVNIPKSQQPTNRVYTRYKVSKVQGCTRYRVCNNMTIISIRAAVNRWARREQDWILVNTPDTTTHIDEFLHNMCTPSVIRLVIPPPQPNHPPQKK